MDIEAQQAREYHRLALESESLAAGYRLQRDRIIRRLREQDRRKWSLGRLAKDVGCSRELIAYIVGRKPVPPPYE